MTDNTYFIDLLATGTTTITVDDDGIGSDWLVFSGVYAAPTDIRLSWYADAGVSTQASGSYFNPGNIGHRLVVNGLIENVRGSNGADFIQGNEQNNILYGDNLSSGPGGADSIFGFDGNDTIYGGAGDDSIGGANGDDLLFGDDGADTISGGEGRDTVIGGAGADVLSGGGDAHDLVSYSGSTLGVTIAITYGTATTGHGGHAEGDSITGFADVAGSSRGDVIYDTVKGTIAFGYNDNVFYGGFGNDKLYLGGGNDTGHGGNDADLILGEQGNDLLMGEQGTDTLRGGVGADVLFGGTEADTFQFTSHLESTVAAPGRDSIRDFSTAEGDHIDLSLIDAKTHTAGNDAFTFIGDAAFVAGVDGQLRAVTYGSGWLVTGDLNGDRIADFGIYVVSPTALTAGDFILY